MQGIRSQNGVTFRRNHAGGDSQDAENVLFLDPSTGYTGVFVLQKFIEYILTISSLFCSM